jgi:hypothetical protein
VINWLLAIIDTQPKKDLLRTAFGLWRVTSAIGAVLIIGLFLLLAARRARRRAAGGQPWRRRRAIPDAWAEAGRRVEPIRMDEPEPPTAAEP